MKYKTETFKVRHTSNPLIYVCYARYRKRFEGEIILYGKNGEVAFITNNNMIS